MPASPDSLDLTVDASGLVLGEYVEQILISSDTPEVVGSVTLTAGLGGGGGPGGEADSRDVDPAPSGRNGDTAEVFNVP